MIALLFCSLLLATLQSTTPELDLQLKGNDGIGSTELRDLLYPWIQDLKQNPTDTGALDDLVYELQAVYLRFGYPEVKVNSQPPKKKDGNWRIKLRIHEGRQRLLKDIEFTGNQQFKDERLRDGFSWKQAGWLSWLGGGKIVYSKDVLDSGLAGIRLLYRLEGYQHVTTDAKTFEKSADDAIEIKLLITIVEGTQAKVGSFSIPQREDAAELRKASRIDQQDWFTPRLPGEIEKRIERHFAEKGFPNAQAEVVTTDHGDRHDLTLTVKTGAPAIISSIRFSGNNHTERRWLRRHLSFGLGDKYQRSALEKSRRMLLNTGLFTSVQLKALTNADDAQRLDIVVELIEKERIRIAGKVGFGSYELGRLGGEIWHLNVFGRGWRGKMEAMASFKGEEALAQLRIPLVSGSDLALNLTGEYERFEELSYTLQRFRQTFSLGRSVPWQLKLVGGYEIRDNKNLAAQDGISLELEEDARSALLFFSASRDARDDLLYATDGTYSTFRAEHAHKAYGSELDFLRLTSRHTRYWTPFESWTLVANGAAGWIRRPSSKPIPLVERFTLGGARSIRSFTERELGPRNPSNDFIGGEAYLQANLELRFPIWGKVGGSAFFDAASLLRNTEDFGRKGDRYGVGGGLMLHTPIGPLRVDAGYSLNPRDDEDNWAVHFLLGHPF